MPKVNKISDYKWKYFCDCGKSMTIESEEIILKPVKCFNCMDSTGGEKSENKKSVNHVKGKSEDHKNRISNSSGQSGSLFE